MANDNRTEKATPRRRQKARERGQVARSRELSSSLALAAGVLSLAYRLPGSIRQFGRFLERWLASAPNRQALPVSAALTDAGALLWSWCAPLMLGAFAVAAAASLAQGGPVVAAEALAPQWGRLNPANKLSELMSVQSAAALLKSLLPAGAVCYLSFAVLARDWGQLLGSGRTTPQATAHWLGRHLVEIGWKSALVMVAWSGLDYLVQRYRHEQRLRMSKQEVREEFRENEGDPAIKGKIRRLQRQVRRARMLRDLPKAAVVVTNPSEYAVALEYVPERMAVPVVVAKGRHLLAREIKNLAQWHGIPMVENPRVARALYRTVEIGQGIPSRLYAAVAEILAFIYRVQRQGARLEAR